MTKNNLREKTAELFAELARQPESKNSLREKITLLNKGLSHTIAQAYRAKCPVPYEDLLQMCNMGLWMATKDYDPSKGSFSSYAAQKMRSEMQHFYRDKFNIVRGPRKERDGVKLINDLWRDSHIDGLPLLTKEEIAYIEYGWDKSTYERAISSTKRSNVSSLDCGDVGIEIKDNKTPEGLAIESEDQRRKAAAIETLLSPLEPIDQRLVRHRYLDEMSTAEISLMYGLSKPEVDVRINDAIQSMRSAV